MEYLLLITYLFVLVDGLKIINKYKLFIILCCLFLYFNEMCIKIDIHYSINGRIQHNY